MLPTDKLMPITIRIVNASNLPALDNLEWVYVGHPLLGTYLTNRKSDGMSESVSVPEMAKQTESTPTQGRGGTRCLDATYVGGTGNGVGRWSQAKC